MPGYRLCSRCGYDFVSSSKHDRLCDECVPAHAPKRVAAKQQNADPLPPESEAQAARRLELNRILTEVILRPRSA
jgi:hypothetical protein